MGLGAEANPAVAKSRRAFDMRKRTHAVQDAVDAGGIKGKEHRNVLQREALDAIDERSERIAGCAAYQGRSRCHWDGITQGDVTSLLHAKASTKLTIRWG